MQIHKTFEHKNKKKQEKYVTLYMAKKFKYLKYFIIPALIIFIFLCTFINKDITNDMYHVKQSKANPGQSLNLLKSKIFNTSPRKTILKFNSQRDYITPSKNNIKGRSDSTSKRDLQSENIEERIFLKTLYMNRSLEKSNFRVARQVQQELDNDILNQDIANIKNTKQTDFATEKMHLSSSKLDPVNFLAPAISCKEYKENCTLYCLDGSVSYIDDNLEQLQTKCRNIDLNLTVAKCEFYNGIFQQSFFFGFFSLGYLDINECNLQTIKPNAFKHNNAKNLHTLIMTNNQLISLQSSAFDGLTNLLNFEFVQAPLSTLFEGVLFLKPLENKLSKAIIQPSRNDSKVMDPFNWWQELQMNSLTKLDISNTNLQDVLNSYTFQPFVVLEYLILYNCNMLSVTADIFDFISSSLKYLDLSLNHLQTLDSNFLQKLGTPSIQLNLSSNVWYCECDGEMMQYFLYHNVKLTEEIFCAAPEKWKQLELTQVIEDCKKSETTLLTTSEISTIFSTTLGTIFSSTTTVIPDQITDISSTLNLTNPTSTTDISSENTSTNPTTEASSNTTTTTEESSIRFSTSTTPATEPSFNTTTTTEKTSISATTESTSAQPAAEPSSSTTITTEESSDVSSTKVDPHPENIMPIQCNLNEKKTETFWSYVTKPQTNFSLHTNSSTSLTIAVQLIDILEKISILYRTKDDHFVYDYDYGEESEIQDIIYIQGLLPSVPYVFCIHTESSLNVSPFDCKSHTIDMTLLKTKWILKSDKVWFISVNCAAAVFLFLVSILVAYILLRFKPHWIIKHKSSSKMVSVTGKSSCASQRSSRYLSSLSLPQNVGNTGNENIIYDSQHTVPCLSAPSLPTTAKIFGKKYKSSSYTETESKPPKKDNSQNMDYLDVIENCTGNENIVYDSQHIVPCLSAPGLPPTAKIFGKKYKSSIYTDTDCRPPKKDNSQNMEYLDVIKNCTGNENIQHTVPCLSAPSLPPTAKIFGKKYKSSSYTETESKPPKKDNSQNMDYLDVIENCTGNENIVYDSQHTVPCLSAPSLPPTAKIFGKKYKSSIYTETESRPPKKDNSQNMEYLDVIENCAGNENIIYDSQHTVPCINAPKLPPTAKIFRKTNNSSCSTTTKNLLPKKYCSQNMISLDVIENDNGTEAMIDNSQYAVPCYSAPNRPLPTQSYKTSYNSSCSTRTRSRLPKKNCSQNTDYLDVIENEPDYQTIDHYEPINF